jgi:hypothetical protein
MNPWTLCAILESAVSLIDKNKEIRSIINYLALGVVILYLIIVVIILLAGFFNLYQDDELIFGYTLYIMLWGGVAVIVLVFLLMMLKLTFTKK